MKKQKDNLINNNHMKYNDPDVANFNIPLQEASGLQSVCNQLGSYSFIAKHTLNIPFNYRVRTFTFVAPNKEELILKINNAGIEVMRLLPRYEQWDKFVTAAYRIFKKYDIDRYLL